MVYVVCAGRSDSVEEISRDGGESCRDSMPRAEVSFLRCARVDRAEILYEVKTRCGHRNAFFGRNGAANLLWTLPEII